VFLDTILNPDFQQRVKSDSHRSQQDRQADDLPPIQQSDDATAVMRRASMRRSGVISCAARSGGPIGASAPRPAPA
jgi:hypothetical protein